MDLIGSRTTLIVNICAIAVASIVVAEGAYIVHECRGYYRPQDIWPTFTPAAIMFIIRNRAFSYFFLALHVAVASQILRQILSLGVDPYACGGRLGDPLDVLIPFFFLSVVCLAIYLAILLVASLIPESRSND